MTPWAAVDQCSRTTCAPALAALCEEEAVGFVATDAVGGLGQRMADDTRAEVESHRTQDGRAELKETRLAAGAAEQREDGRRKEFAADLVPREGRLFEDPHRSALTHGGKCGHHAARASAPQHGPPASALLLNVIIRRDAAFL